MLRLIAINFFNHATKKINRYAALLFNKYRKRWDSTFLKFGTFWAPQFSVWAARLGWISPVKYVFLCCGDTDSGSKCCCHQMGTPSLAAESYLPHRLNHTASIRTRWFGGFSSGKTATSLCNCVLAKFCALGTMLEHTSEFLLAFSRTEKARTLPSFP